MLEMAGRRLLSWTLDIQRTRSCSSGVPWESRDFALASAAVSGVVRRAAKEIKAYAIAECGSFSVAWRAWSAEASYIAFSYRSQASSMDLRDSSDLVDSGMAPKRRCEDGATGDV